MSFQVFSLSLPQTNKQKQINVIINYFNIIAMKLFINFLLSSLVAFAAIEFLPGLDVDNYLIAIFIALIIGLINISIKPFLLILSIIPTFITIVLALFFFNGLIIVLSDWIIEGFSAEGTWYVILFSAVISILNWCIHRLIWK